MRYSLEQAQHVFSQLPPFLQAPEHNPHYIEADALRKEELQPTYFLFEEQGQHYYHSFHMAPIPGTAFFDIQSPYGYGGPIATTEDPGFLQHAWQAYCQWCRQENVMVEFMRFHPLLANQKQYGGVVAYNRDTVWLELQGTDLWKSYAPRNRTAIRKGLAKELQFYWCEPDAFLRVFPQLYYENMKHVQADSFYFFNDAYFARILQLPGARAALCEHEGEAVAGAVFLGGEALVEYHLSAMSGKGRALSAMNFLLHEAVSWSQQQGFARFHLGGGTDAAEDNPLLFFKKSFSQKLADFYIGHYVHQPEAYAQMKKIWLQERALAETKRILFYRL